MIYLLQGVLFLLAWQLRYHSDVTIVAVFLGFAAALLLALFVAERRGWRWRGVGEFRLETSRLGERLQLLKQPQRVPRWTRDRGHGLHAAYFAGVALAVGHVGRDIGWLAVGLATVLGSPSCSARRCGAWTAITQGVLYVAVVIAVYLDHTDPDLPKLFVFAKLALFPVLALAVAIRFRLSRERRFEVTPLDLLVIFVALALPNLPGLSGAPSNLGLSVAKLVVLFYALEMLSNHSERTRAWLWRGRWCFWRRWRCGGWCRRSDDTCHTKRCRICRSLVHEALLIPTRLGVTWAIRERPAREASTCQEYVGQRHCAWPAGGLDGGKCSCGAVDHRVWW